MKCIVGQKFDDLKRNMYNKVKMYRRKDSISTDSMSKPCITYFTKVGVQ